MSKIDHAGFMRIAVDLAYKGMDGGHGGPFGAVIVKDGKIIGKGYNRVLLDNDPTAHAEMTAIRAASAKIKGFNLSGSVIYASGFPCPMCMSAIFCGRIDKVYYACSSQDNSAIGFDDQKFYRQLELPPGERDTHLVQLTQCYDDALKCYATWFESAARTPY
jgi:tRNA(Arg) A34 adenosine deaminase TadA